MIKKITPIILFGLMLVSFQNCQEAMRFNADYSSTVFSASIDGSAVYYTNQKNVSVNVNLSSEFMSEMRASIHEDMDKENVAWGAIKTQILVELESEYAADGSKDGLKKIYIETRDPKTDKRFNTAVDVFLDTQAPLLNSEGLLALGTQGKMYSKGSSVNLTWTSSDKVASTGVSSGLDENAGFRWGIAATGDCSESSLQQKSEWMSLRNSISISWPSDDPLTAFYFCIYAKDKAGNVGTLLSQPMTSIWQVIAGDNNQGNGGSVTAKSVRFGYPTRLAVDSKNNIYVADAYMNVIRRISSTGIISSFAGTGVNSSAKVGDILQSNISGIGDIAIDSKDRLYVITGGAIWRITLGATESDANIFAQWTASIGGTTRIKIDKSSDTLYMSYHSSTRTTATSAYIYKIKINDIDAKFTTTKTRPALADFSSYIYAGNGTSLASTTNFTTPNPLAATETVDYPTALAIGDDGEIYYATTSDGAGYPFGHQQIRMLKKDANGVLQNYMLTNTIAWAHMIEFVHNKPTGGTEEKYLLVSTDGSGLRKINLIPDSGTLTYPLKTAAITTIDPYPSTDLLHPIRVGGVVAVYDKSSAGVTSLTKLVVSESNNSRMMILNSDHTLSINYGRAVYNAADVVATEAMINNPDGVAQAKNGDIYITEPLSHIVRKINSAGKISLVAGTPGKRVVSSDSVTYDFTQFTYDGLNYTNGFRWGLLYDSATNFLYMTDGSARRIRKFDLTQSLVTTFGPKLTARTTDPDSWYPYSIAMAPVSAANRDLIVYQGNLYYPYVGAMVRAYSTTDSSVSSIAGTGESGTVVLGNADATPLQISATASAVDSQSNYYFSSAGGTFKVDKKTNVLSRISTTNSSSLELVEDSNGTHLFQGLTTSLQYTKIAKDGTVTAMALCLPGTYLNRAIQVTISQDGNLLIADSRNDRILKYLIRDSAQGMKLYNSTCKL